MSKKILLLMAFGLMVQAAPVFAEGADSAVGSGQHKQRSAKMEKMDPNGDGVISKSEFLKNAEERFEKIDTNGDGQISREEGKAGREAMRGKMKEKHEAWKEKKQERKQAQETAE